MKIRHLDLLRQSLSSTGLLVGTLLFAASLSPSLVPRPFMLQALLAGVALAAGYGVGVFLHWLWHFMELPEFKGRGLWIGKIVAWTICSAVAVGFLFRASAWQDSIRELMALPPVETTRPFSVGLIALLVFALLLGLARLLRFVKRTVARTADRWVPGRIALVVGVLVTATLVWSLASGVFARLVLNSFDASFQQLDLLIEDELDPPGHPLATGSGNSLLDWDGLGRQGRRFIARTSTLEELAQTSPAATHRPLRIYVGLNSAATIEERVQLALSEMQRVGAFQRDYLVIVTPTGTGWIDPGAIRSLEHLVGGNVASVAVQYSYLPSWLSLLAQAEYGQETARALFAEVYRHWRDLPTERRPRLFVHGLSLGALNSARSADIWDLVGDPIDGALWSGPPFRSEAWQWLTTRRNPGSPAWLPRFRDGSVVRFANQHGGLEDFDAPWGPFRIAYLQYASDPISFFRPDALYREPAWMRGARAHDVSPKLRWYPIVTFLQLAVDIAAAETAPIGHGHNYATEHYIEAWHALLEPPGWDAGRLGELKRRIGDLWSGFGGNAPQVLATDSSSGTSNASIEATSATGSLDDDLPHARPARGDAINALDEYLEILPQAEAGDSAAQYRLARLIQSCRFQPRSRLDIENAIRGGENPHQALLDLMARELDRCGGLGRIIEDFDRAANGWLDRAAAQEDPLALAEMAVQDLWAASPVMTGPERARRVQEALRARPRESVDIANRFVANSSAPADVGASWANDAWWLAACTHLHQCDRGEVMNHIRQAYKAYEVDEILLLESAIDQAVRTGKWSDEILERLLIVDSRNAGP